MLTSLQQFFRALSALRVSQPPGCLCTCCFSWSTLPFVNRPFGGVFWRIRIGYHGYQRTAVLGPCLEWAVAMTAV